jgi:hypothetical protein
MYRTGACCSGICVYCLIFQNYVPPDARSSQEKANSLVQQLLEEHEIDSKQPDVADEIAQRLARLRGQDTTSHHTPAGEEKVPCKNLFV